MINPDKIKSERQQVLEQLQRDEAAFEQGQKALTEISDRIKLQRGAVAALNRALELDEQPEPPPAAQ